MRLPGAIDSRQSVSWGSPASKRPPGDREAFTCVCADPRGHGKSRQLAGAYAIEEIAADAPSRIKGVVAACPISAAANRLSAEAHAFVASTREDDDALCRRPAFVGNGLSHRRVEEKPRQNRRTVDPGCAHGYLAAMMRTGMVDEDECPPYFACVIENFLGGHA